MLSQKNIFHHLLFFLDIDYCWWRNMKKLTLSWCFFISQEHLLSKKKTWERSKKGKTRRNENFFLPRMLFFCSHLIQFKTRVAKYLGCHEKFQGMLEFVLWINTKKSTSYLSTKNVFKIKALAILLPTQYNLCQWM